MEPKLRRPYNAAFTDSLYDHYVGRIERELGPPPFRVAETPLFVPAELHNFLERSSLEILHLLSQPEAIERMRPAIPERFLAPRMDVLPSCAQLDFAIVRDEDGRLTGRIVELQGFPSVYGFTLWHGRIFRDALQNLPGLKRSLAMWFGGLDFDGAVAALRRTVVADEDPELTVLLDLDPPYQKTFVDFVATQRLIGIDPVCATEVVRDGRRLLRRKNGRLVPIRRIFNRVVFDELERKGMALPFSFADDLDVTWVPHPNWYWVWSKYSLLYLRHPAIPYVVSAGDAAVRELDLGRFVLKPLFSFAGSGVKVDVTPADLEAIPAQMRAGWILQRKIDYARELRMPDGNGVAAEIRVMCLRAPGESALRPAWNLVRLSRGKMMGVDHNKELTWVGSSVGLWEG